MNATVLDSDLRPYDLRCEHLESPPAVEAARPRLSWKLRDPRAGATERGYQVVVASTPEGLNAPDLWDSGKVAGRRPDPVVYAGKRLRSGQQCHWRVRSWDLAGRPTAWSEPAGWCMGLLKPADWIGAWISPPGGSDAPAPEENACWYFRGGFTVRGPVRRARLYVAALGLVEPWINGRAVTDDCLIPGSSHFPKRAQYVAYDVTPALAAGDGNWIGLILAPGWYAGHVGRADWKFRFGDVPAVRGQLVIEYSDGAAETIGTAPDWEAARGPILSSHLYDGETFDARKGRDWPAVSPGAQPLRARDFPGRPPRLTGKRCAPVRRQEEVAAVKVTRAPTGEWIFDFGQNLVGWARLRIRAERGREIVLRFAEMLQGDGNLYVANLGTAKATDRYIAAGSGEEIWEPRFTFHGFRFAGLSGVDGVPPSDTLTAVVLHTAMPVAGEFECSNPDLNRLQRNIAWGQRGNFVDVPTDCPQRDERMGWTGDAQVFFRTAAFNRDVAAFFEKWLDDLDDAQRPGGAFPDVAPDVLPRAYNAGNAAWADAGVICPWRLYVETGDPEVLARHYAAMRRWIEYQRRTSRNGIRPDTRYGDWLATDAVTPYTAPTPRSLIGTAYFAYTTGLVTEAARTLGKRGDAVRLDRLRRRIVAAFQREFVTAAGRVVGDTQTGYCLALAFDLLPPSLRAVAVDHLVRLVDDRQGHLTTGFVGTPLLCPVLTRFGRADVAERLILQDTYPSWLYPVKLGATTMWERWNSYSPETGFGDPSMNSFNHYAYGAIGEWLYAHLGGIAPVESAPGYARVRCAPRPGAGLAWARTWHDTPRGRVSVSWRLEAGRRFSAEFIIPPDTVAEISLPAGVGPRREFRVGGGTHRFAGRLAAAPARSRSLSSSP